jgi:hypothetical protein
MYSLFDAEEITTLTKEDILNRVTEETIWRRYCPNFIYIGKSFLSELYKDNNPGCYIFYKDGRLIYKDHGTGESYDCFAYVMAKYLVSFSEALKIIASDFNISPIKHHVKDKVISQGFNEIMPVRGYNKPKIRIIKQAYTITDKDYWGQYYINLDKLIDYEVYSLKQVVIDKDGEVYSIDYKADNPIYGYVFKYDNNEYYKIYRPYNKSKWLFTGNSRCIEGWHKLPKKGKLLIITKSLKDIMVYSLFGIPAISMPSETGTIADDTISKLKKRFKHILINFDNDETGLNSADRLSKRYGLDHYVIPDSKDISDFIKVNGINKTNNLLNELIGDKRSKNNNKD